MFVCVNRGRSYHDFASKTGECDFPLFTVKIPEIRDALQQPYEINIKGYLSSLIDSELSVIKMVAEEGFEPPTQGL